MPTVMPRSTHGLQLSPTASGRTKGSPAAWAASQSPCTPALSMSYCPRSCPVPEPGWVLPWGRGQHLGCPPPGTFPHPSLSHGGLIARSLCPGHDLLPHHGEIAGWAARLGLGDGGRRGVLPPPRLGGSPHAPLVGNSAGAKNMKHGSRPRNYGINHVLKFIRWTCCGGLQQGEGPRGPHDADGASGHPRRIFACSSPKTLNSGPKVTAGPHRS